MGKRTQGERQSELWIATSEIVQTPGHVFYDRLNELLRRHGFDACVEHLCRRYYPGHRGRPSIAPGVYFRMLLVGFFEGLDSERGIAWRVADSLSLRKFIGYDLNETTPDHSTISRTRRLFWLSTHRAVFAWVLRLLAKEGLLVGKTVAIDASTLEANAAMRSIVRRDSGLGYEAYVRQLAAAEGIEQATPEQLARFDRKRKKRTSNEDWRHPHDPDARVAKMKDGRTHMAHKVEHAVDTETGAIVAMTLQPADLGDTTTVQATLPEAQRQVKMATGADLAEAVLDKGYHSDEMLKVAADRGVRTYTAEPERGRRRWQGRSKEAEQKRLYGNRRRIRGRRGRALQRRRAEVGERSFAHMYETGGMRRTHLRGHRNILKRLVVHGAGFNLSIAIRRTLGTGKPRQLQRAAGAALRLFFAMIAQFGDHIRRDWAIMGSRWPRFPAWRAPALRGTHA